MLAVKAGVVNEPVVPVPPPPDEVQEVLSLDDQAMTLVAPIMIEDEDAETDTVGVGVALAATTVVVESPLPPHEARPVTASNAANKAFSKTFELTALLFDMIVSLQ